MSAARTFRENLVRGAFLGTYPPWSSAEDLERFYVREGCVPEMQRAYELGKVYRETKELAAEQVQELDDMAKQPGVFFRMLAKEKEAGLPR